MPSRILQLGNPLLRREAETVPLALVKTEKIQSIIDDIVDVMRDIKTISPSNGNGLCAPQIGYSAKIIVLFFDDAHYPVINPAIVEASDPFEYGEGCLSYFYLRAKVERFRHIKVEGRDRDGEPVHLEFHDDMAGLAQHEIDHINGIPYIDRVDSKALISVDEYYSTEPDKLERAKQIITYVTSY